MKKSPLIFWLSVVFLSLSLIQIAPLGASGQALYDRNKDVRKDRQLQKQKQLESSTVPKAKKETPKIAEEKISKPDETKSTEDIKPTEEVKPPEEAKPKEDI